MIAPADSASERAAVYGLRYDVLVGEQGIVADQSIDHSRHIVIDPADSTGIILAAWLAEGLAGTVRTNLLRDGPARPFCELIGLDRIPAADRQFASVTSRLVVDARWRRTSLGVRLAQAISRYCREAGMKWDYIIVRPVMAPFFVRLGYESLGAALDFPGVGTIEAMRLNLDLAHLRGINSVLVAPLPRTKSYMEPVRDEHV